MSTPSTGTPDLHREALERFERLFAKAQTLGLHEPTAMTLATVDDRGHPTARTVLLKGVNERGFVFYTNLESRKGRHLRARPQAALCFFWDPMMEQALIEGATAQVSDAEADAYWVTRQRMSQLGAWASQQSQPLDNRTTLDARLADAERRFGSGPIPRPPHWSGFRLAPERIEFWTAQPFRLNERTVYERRDGAWQRYLLYP